MEKGEGCEGRCGGRGLVSTLGLSYAALLAFLNNRRDLHDPNLNCIQDERDVMLTRARWILYVALNGHTCEIHLLRLRGMKTRKPSRACHDWLEKVAGSLLTPEIFTFTVRARG